MPSRFLSAFRVVPLRLAPCFLVLSLAVAPGCQSSRSLAAPEADRGPSQHFAADFEEVVEATREALPGSGMRIDREEPRSGESRAHAFYADTGFRLARGGEVSRFTVVEATGGGSYVYVLTRPRLDLGLPTRGDYAQADLVFRQIQLRLEGRGRERRERLVRLYPR